MSKLNHFFKANWNLKSRPVAYFMLTISAILYTVAVHAFLTPAGTFSTGVGSVAQLLTYTVSGIHNYFSLLYLALNVPLIIFYWNKIKKRFLIRTCYFLVVQACLGIIFIPSEVSSVFANVINFDIKKEGWPIFVLPIAGGVIFGLSLALSWKYGGSTGGTDFVGYYYSTRRKISVGRVLFLLSCFFLTFSFVVTMALVSETRHLWYLTLLSTFIFVCLSYITLDFVYPKYAKVKLEIHSDQIDKIKDQLARDKFNHSYSVIGLTSGYTGLERRAISTVILLLEVKPLIQELKKIDPNLWISVTKVRNIYGNFDTTKID